MDIPAILDRIRPGAKWRRADTYAALQATWEDQVQTLPTEQEINDAWAATQTAMNTESALINELKAQTALVLKSPNGTRYKITVSNAGVLSTVQI